MRAVGARMIACCAISLAQLILLVASEDPLDSNLTCDSRDCASIRIAQDEVFADVFSPEVKHSMDAGNTSNVEVQDTMQPTVASILKGWDVDFESIVLFEFGECLATDYSKASVEIDASVSHNSDGQEVGVSQPEETDGQIVRTDTQNAEPSSVEVEAGAPTPVPATDGAADTNENVPAELPESMGSDPVSENASHVGGDVESHIGSSQAATDVESSHLAAQEGQAHGGKGDSDDLRALSNKVLRWFTKLLNHPGVILMDLPKGALPKDASCDAHPGCVELGLEGECCPTPDGISLWCCS